MLEMETAHVVGQEHTTIPPDEHKIVELTLSTMRFQTDLLGLLVYTVDTCLFLLAFEFEASTWLCIIIPVPLVGLLSGQVDLPARLPRDWL
jgi:hypothetical protein